MINGRQELRSPFNLLNGLDGRKAAVCSSSKSLIVTQLCTRIVLTGVLLGDVDQARPLRRRPGPLQMRAKIECGGCGNSTTLNGFDVAKAYGTKDFADIEGRMKCSRCGVKEAQLTVLPPLEPR